ncbi:hypothetical protein SPF06_21425 [Sinomonas sp. JGH33]|uniref:Uncharacterized protein n=1 Tax=Sinomonas terricola TaxID=3110330 RepID=A0ABU5TCW5_9MICC|nr:hypothetical protein [Sinomonas sp. JGH33]MEA5457286.1 hypothetical protein [Sinomonas sp. JGH33]
MQPTTTADAFSRVRNASPASIESAFAEHAPHAPAGAYPALGGVPLSEIHEHFRNRSVPAAWKNAVLAELVEAAQSGDTLAHLAVLVVFVPKAIAVATSTRALRRYPLKDAVSIYLGALWEQVLVHPLHRSGSVAGNLTLGALHSVTEEDRRDPALVDALRTDGLDGGAVEYVLHQRSAGAETENPAETSEKDVADLFAWSLDSGILTPEEVSLVSLWYLGGSEGQAAAAARLGLSRDSARRHICRVRTKLTSAVRDEVAANGWT